MNRRTRRWGERLEERDLLTTTLLPPIGEVALSSYPHDLVTAGDYVYFSTGSGTSGTQLWRTDGTPTGTIPLLNPAPRIVSLPVGDALYFAGTAIYRTEGTPESTVRLTDSRYVVDTPQSLVAFQDDVYFVGRDLDRTRNPDRVGRDLMKTSGTPESTGYAGLHDADRSTSGAEILGVWNDRLHYWSRQSRQLIYRSTDGTLDGTLEEPNHKSGFADSNVRPEIQVGEWILGTTGPGWESPAELVAVDPETGERVLIDLDPDSSAYPSRFFPLGDRAFFTAIDSAHGSELWSTDGTIDGTQRISDIVPGPSGSNPDWLTEFQSQLVFSADHGVWTYDATSSSLSLVKKFRDVPSSLGPQYLTVVDDALYFVADGGNGDELWKYDGQTVTEVVDLVPGPDGSNPAHLTLKGDQLFFSATVPEVGNELWVLDTTDDSVQLLADLRVGTTSNPPILPRDLFVYQGISYFRMNDRVSGTELWRTDGTAEGTFMLADINPGLGSSGPRNFFIFQDQLYFAANDGTHGYELWTTDGTAANTRMVLDLWPGPEGLIDSVVVGGDKFYFAGHDGVHGIELWESDGTADGTRMTADLTEGFPSTPIRNLQIVGENVFFYVDGSETPTNVSSDFMKWDGETLTVVLEQPEIFGRRPIAQLTMFGDDPISIGGRGVVYYPADDRSSILGRANLEAIEFVRTVEGDRLAAIGTSRGLYFVQEDREVLEVDPTLVADVWSLDNYVVYSAGPNPRIDLRYFTPGSSEPIDIVADVEPLLTYRSEDTLWMAVRHRDESIELWSFAESGAMQSRATFESLPKDFVVVGDQVLYTASTGAGVNEGVFALTLPPEPAVSFAEVDAIFAAVRGGETDPQSDRNEDGTVDEADLDHLFDVELMTSRADLNLNGTVDFADFLLLSANFGRTEDASWSRGDIDQDDEVGFADFLLLSSEFGSADGES